MIEALPDWLCVLWPQEADEGLTWRFGRPGPPPSVIARTTNATVTAIARIGALIRVVRERGSCRPLHHCQRYYVHSLHTCAPAGGLRHLENVDQGSSATRIGWRTTGGAARKLARSAVTAARVEGGTTPSACFSWSCSNVDAPFNQSVIQQ